MQDCCLFLHNDKVHATYSNSVILTLVGVVQAISPGWECSVSEGIISVANIHLWNTFLLLLEILENLGLSRFGKDKFNQDLNAFFLIGSYSGQILNHWMHLFNAHEQFWFQIECIFCVSVNSCHFLFFTVSWLLISFVVYISSICVVATLKPKTILNFAFASIEEGSSPFCLFLPQRLHGMPDWLDIFPVFWQFVSKLVYGSLREWYNWWYLIVLVLILLCLWIILWLIAFNFCLYLWSCLFM